ncbi:MAG: branched-chain amino acid ABC transporter permease, partial [Microvirga sp.]
VVGLIVLPRTTGIQLAVLTLALSQLVLLYASYTDALGRDDGLSGLKRPRLDLGSFTIDLTPLPHYYYFILFVSVAVTALLLWFVSGPRGRILLAVRIDPERAAFLGVNVRRQRIMAFTLAGAIAALVGAVAAPWAQIVSTDSMSWLSSAQPMLATLLGGAGSFWGPVIGTFGLALINYATRTFAGLSELTVGGVLLIVVMIAPAGILGLARSFSRRSRPERQEPA